MTASLFQDLQTSEPSSDTIKDDNRRAYLFKSKARLIGKTYWAFVVYAEKDFDFAHHERMKKRFNLWSDKEYPDRCTSYMYLDGKVWRDMTEHPRYNSHDGTYAGLPKSLIGIYRDNIKQIDFYLGKQG